jgi:hypothetical protein
VTGRLLAAESVTVKFAFTVPGPSPSTTVASPIDSVGVGSSSLIVPTPWPSASVALSGGDRLTKKLSSSSSRTSPLTGTEIVFVVCPAAKVNVPLTVW